MIRSFGNRDAELIFNGKRPRRLPQELARKARRLMLILHRATSPEDLRSPPGNRLEKLSGDRKGQYSVRVNNQYRLCFTWHDGHADDVELVDYH